MKPITTFALLSAFFAVAAQGAVTKPVGYETLSLLPNAFNYLGLRLHESTVNAGSIDAITATTVTDTGADFSNLSANPNTFYILEILDGSGIISEFQGSDVSGDTITIPDDLTGAVSTPVDYAIRPAATLDSVFGPNNEAGLSPGTFSTLGADLIFVPDGAGDFNGYYYDSIGGWSTIALAPVTGAETPLVYSDGVIISASANAPASLVVTGELKTSETQLPALADAFNYFSSVAPTATLADLFDPAELDQGTFSTLGADLIFFPDGSGGFNSYYYDSIGGWSTTALAPVDATTIDATSGVLFSNFGAQAGLTGGVPDGYSSL